MQVPQPMKIVVNMGVGRATQQRSLLDGAVTDLTIITGQKPLVHQGEEVDRELQAPRGQRDRRQGDVARRPDVGVLRPAREPGDPAHPTTSAACRRSSSTDTATTRSGSTSNSCFPEIDYDKIDSVRGMNVTIVTTAETDAQGLALLRALGFPFRRDGQAGVIRWPRRHSSTSSSARRSSRCAATRAAAVAAGRARCTATSVCVDSVCARWLTRGEIPGMTKSSW